MDVNPESLEGRCLFFIVENFEWYIWAFQYRHHNRVVARQFELLALAFSEKLFFWLKTYGKLKKEFFDFLINPHLKNLDIEGMDEKLITPYFVRQLGIHGHNVVNFKARLNEICLYKEIFSALPNVETIEINGVCSVQTLEVIGNCCPVLRVLKGSLLTPPIVDKSMLREDEFAAICFLLDKCDKLEVLDYSEEHGLVVQVLCRRHQIDAEHNVLEKCRKYALRKLSFGFRIYNMKNALNICSVLCPSVSSVIILCGLTKDRELSLCSNFKLLEDVTISFARIGQNAMKQFLKSTKRRLIKFELSHSSLCVVTLIKCCPNLQSLTLFDVKFLDFKDKSDTRIHLLSYLRTVALVKIDFSNDVAARSCKLILSLCKSIKNLSVLHCEGLTNEHINSILLGCQNLISLELSKASLSFLTLATYCSKVQTLNLSDVTVLAFNAKGLSPTVNLSLRTVTLTNVDFSEQSTLVSFQLILSLCRNIEKLSMNNCKGLSDTFIGNLMRKVCFPKIKDPISRGSFIGVCPSVKGVLIHNLKDLHIENCRCVQCKDHSNLYVFKKMDQSTSKWIMCYNPDQTTSYGNYDDDCSCSSEESSYEYNYNDYLPFSDEEEGFCWW